MSDSTALWTVALQAFLSMGFSRQEYWRELSSSPPGDLSDPGIKSASLALAGGFFTTSATWPSEPPRKEKSESVNHCHAQLFATLWTITPRLLSPWNSPDKKNGVGCHFLLQGTSPPRDGKWVSCTAADTLLSEPPGKPQSRRSL